MDSDKLVKTGVLQVAISDEEARYLSKMANYPIHLLLYLQPIAIFSIPY